MADGKEKKELPVKKGLTLQQKFIELRKAVPAIVQKKHSDSVKYKFAKIFDVYELLTPAMNQYGVNFDIVAETATHHDTNGDGLFYHSYMQNTQYGQRHVWVYEADLTIRWTNADNPEDILEVTLHAIGTNDGGPDKAKGSAWTYCLKYYLFEKFGIDQGEDDPDNKDLSGAPVNSQKQGQEPRNNSGKGNTQPSQKNGQRELSQAQLDRMYKKGEAAGMSREQVNDRTAKKYNLKDPAKMTREQYDETCAALDAAKQQEQQGGTDNA